MGRETEATYCTALLICRFVDMDIDMDRGL